MKFRAIPGNFAQFRAIPSNSTQFPLIPPKSAQFRATEWGNCEIKSNFKKYFGVILI